MSSWEGQCGILGFNNTLHCPSQEEMKENTHETIGVRSS